LAIVQLSAAGSEERKNFVAYLLMDTRE